MRYATRTVNVLVLAGGMNRISLFPGYVPGYKALLPVRGRPLIRYTLEALAASGRVGRTCIVGPEEELRRTIGTLGDCDLLEGGDTLLQNIIKGLGHFRNDPVVLVTTADLPLLSPSTVQYFLDACAEITVPAGSTVFWSLVPEEDFTLRERDVRKGFNRFRDRSVCHGNLLLITPRLADDAGFLSRMERIYAARKSSVRAALAIGPLVGLSYLAGVHLFRLLSLQRFASIASFGFGTRLVPIIVHDPDVAMDIDEARDYRFIEEELDRRSGNAA